MFQSDLDDSINFVKSCPHNLPHVHFFESVIVENFVAACEDLHCNIVAMLL